MWASIGSLVQNGQGNRHTATLHAIGVLYERCSGSASVDLDMAFDSVIVQIVPDLDMETVIAIAPSVADFTSQFPLFSAFVCERMQKGNPDKNKDVPQSPASEAMGATATADEHKTPTEPEPPVERRATLRDSLGDQNNPITIARRASQNELVQIAGLPNLPEALTNVLISRGDRMVLERVLLNRSARFARSSLTTLAELAPSDRMIKEALVARNDLPETIVERVLPYLPSAAKARLLLSGAPFNESDCAVALEQASQELAQCLLQGQLMVGLENCLGNVTDGAATSSDVISLLARDARIAELSAFAASQLGICHAAAFNALSGRFDHAAAVLLRALDCTYAAFEDAFGMRKRCGFREAKECKSAWNLAQRYALSDALTMVRLFETVVAPAQLQDVSERSDADAVAFHEELTKAA